MRVYDEFINKGDLKITANYFAGNNETLDEYWNNNYSKNYMDTKPKKPGVRNHFTKKTHLADTVINFWYKYKSANNINYNDYLQYIKSELRNKCFTKLCDKSKKSDKQTPKRVYVTYYDKSMMLSPLSPDITFFPFYKEEDIINQETENEKLKEIIIDKFSIYPCRVNSIQTYEQMIELLNELYCVLISYNIKNKKK
tara:strand:- start:360 stop:950 length:591 start_codon:yes stop_codon:yes gene_type:complete